MVFAVLLVFLMGGATGAVIDHVHPSVGDYITQEDSQ